LKRWNYSLKLAKLLQFCESKSKFKHLPNCSGKRQWNLLNFWHWKCVKFHVSLQASIQLWFNEAKYYPKWITKAKLEQKHKYLCCWGWIDFRSLFKFQFWSKRPILALNLVELKAFQKLRKIVLKTLCFKLKLWWLRFLQIYPARLSKLCHLD